MIFVAENVGLRTVFVSLISVIWVSMGCGIPIQTADAVSESASANRSELIKSTVSPGGIQAILGTPDLAVGSNRLSFVITSSTGFISNDSVRITSYLGENDAEHQDQIYSEDILASLRSWEYANRGFYVATMEFDRPGTWQLNIHIDNETIGLTLLVSEKPTAPAVGAKAIRSKSKTIGDVNDIDELTTGSIKDVDLYRISIADSVSSGKPSVIVFASPAFCTNAVCGPQVQVLQKLKNLYKDRAHFIHIDLYDNPSEIQGNLDNAIISPIVHEWNLPGQEWTFIVDESGTITSRFEGFGTFVELQDSLLTLLE